MNEIFDTLIGKFKSQIINQRVSHNELYLSVGKDAAFKICDDLYTSFDASLVLMFATDERKSSGYFNIHYVFSFGKADAFVIIRIHVKETEPQFQSLTNKIPAAGWYEREIQDMFGLQPVGHPDPRRLVMFEDWPQGCYPLRKDFDIKSKPPRVEGQYEYRRMEGDGVCEIPVGPVHAGIIEPGHFRFSVAGEPILNLEIRHFYTHKGVEKLFENMDIDNAVFLAERVSGDTSVAHSVAFCQALERSADVEIPPRAKYIRTILLELERLYNHTGDIAGIATDSGYSVGAAYGNQLKEDVLKLNEEITGSRLLRGMVTIGGIRRDIGDKVDVMLPGLTSFRHHFMELKELILNKPSVVNRMETTGYISTEIARSLHLVGPVVRATGIDRDIRRNHPYAAYPKLDFKVHVYEEGDVLARTSVRADEVIESLDIIEQALHSLPEGEIKTHISDIPPGCGLGYAEAPRGEVMYWVMTRNGRIERCKVRDPSFCNWLAIEYAVLDNIVPDFPLINKSLSLSYSGNDL